MYSLKEEKISQITPFSVFADNKRIRNKIIEGKSFQATRSGKNRFNKNGLIKHSDGAVVSAILDTGVRVEQKDVIPYGYVLYVFDDLTNYVGKTVRMKTNYSRSAENIKPSYRLGLATIDGSNRTPFSDTGDINSENGISFIVPEITDDKKYLAVWLYSHLGTTDVVEKGSYVDYTNLIITIDNDDMTYEEYGASPSPEFPSEIQSLGDDVNLLQNNATTTTVNGITFTVNSDGTVIANGTATAQATIDIGRNLEDVFNGKYIMSGSPKGSSSSTYYMNLFKTENGTVTSIGAEYGNGITTEQENDCYLWTRIVIASGQTISNLVFKPKIQKGTVATAYSEYGKGTVEIKQSGKNLFNKTTVTEGKYINADSGVFSINDSWGVTDYIEVTENKEYISWGTSTIGANPSICFFDSDKNFISGIRHNNINPFVFATPKSCKYIIESVCLSDIDTFMIEEGTVATEYEPYKGNNYVIPLSQPLKSLPNGVKDTIEEDGIHRRIGSVILDGSDDEGWVIRSDLSNDSFTTFRQYNYLQGNGLITNSKGLCSHFEVLTEGKADRNNVRFLNTNGYGICICIQNDIASTPEELKAWLSLNPIIANYQLEEETIEPFDEEQQAVINEMKTLEGVNNFSLTGDLETTLTFDYNPQITEEIKKAFKYNITKAYLEVAATDKASGFQINEDNYLQSIDFDDCRYIEGEGVIGSCVAKELQGKFVNVDTSFDIENREVECFIGAETKDNITHYLRLGTFIVQKPENDNVKDNTSFDSLDYMIKFNKEYVHRMAKYLKTEDTDIYPDKQYYILNDSGVYEEVIVPHKEEISNYYEIIDEYTLMQLLKDICEQCEVKLGTFNFRNDNYIVHGNRFDSGVSCRDVLKAIAQAAFSWARINEYNELLLDFETSDTISEEIDYNEYYGLNFNDNYGPVNTIVLKNSQVEGENITIKNDELINSAGGNNIFNYLTAKIVGGASPSRISTERINNGIKITSLTKEQYLSKFIAIDTVENLLKKELTISTDIVLSKEGNKIQFDVIYCDKDGENRTAIKSNIITSSGKLSFKTNKIEKGENRYYVAIRIYTNYAENYEIGDYTEYNNIMMSTNNISEYEDFIPLGPKELAISDNPFAYSEETRKAIIQAGEAIYGFKYVPLSVETIGAAYLNCKDKLKIKNMQDGDLETYVFDTRISYQGTLKSNVETLAMTDTETKYRYDGSLTTAQRRTEFRVDKAEQKITSLVKATTEQGEKLTEAVQDLDGFKRTITDKTDETAEKVTIIEEKVDGLITSKSVSGGQNLIKNSVGYFGNDYWQINAETEGTVLSENSTDVKQNSISGSALKLQAETIYQDIKEIKNGEYYLSFNYKKIINTAIATLKVNDLIINLTEENWKEEAHLINVTTNNIKIEMTTDLNSSILITDLMLTEGNLQVSWTQNANESYTDNVQIGKGVKITATGSDTEFVAEASGITINNTENGNKVAEFTKYGTETQELIAHKDVKIADSLLIQKIGNQTWFSSL